MACICTTENTYTYALCVHMDKDYTYHTSAHACRDFYKPFTRAHTQKHTYIYTGFLCIYRFRNTIWKAWAWKLVE